MYIMNALEHKCIGTYGKQNRGDYMVTVAIVYHSTYGHTKVQAEAVLKGVQSVSGATAKFYTTDEAIANMDELDTADAIIFGCPTYMGSMSASMKTFIEASSKKWYSRSWKDKIAGAFTNSGSFSGDKLNTLLGLVINAMQHGMIYVSLGMLPSENRPEDQKAITGPSPDSHNRVGSFTGPMSSSFHVNPPDAPSKGDVETAELYGRRIAEITHQFVRGKAK
jgi:NAD(P)H dehydrogenase (quinone)